MGWRRASVALAVALGLAVAGCSRTGTSFPAATVADSSLTADQQEVVSWCQAATIRAAHVLTSSYHVADTASEIRITQILSQDGFDPVRSALMPVVYNAWIRDSLAYLGVSQTSLPAQVRSGCAAYVTGPTFTPYELALLCRWDGANGVCTGSSVYNRRP